VAIVGDKLWSHTVLRSAGFTLPLAAHWRSSSRITSAGSFGVGAAGVIGKEIQ
jgi:hypothetical protein